MRTTSSTHSLRLRHEIPGRHGRSITTVIALRHLGHDVAHLGEQSLLRMEDPEIVARARTEGRIVLTFDLDFGEIMALSGNASPSVILFRLRNQTPRIVTPRLLQVIQECQAQLAMALL